MKLFLSICSLLVFLINSSCSSSNGDSHSDLVPKPVASNTPPNPDKHGEDPPPRPMPEEPCLAAMGQIDAVGAVCLTQHRYSFLKFSKDGLSNPATMTIQLYDSEGHLIATTGRPEFSEDRGAPKMSFLEEDGRKIVFFGYKFKADKTPDFGFAIVNGNSGLCHAFRSGTPRSCLNVLKAQKRDYSDSFRLPETAIPITKVDFLYSKVPLIYKSDWHEYYSPKDLRRIRGLLPVAGRALALQSRDG